MDRQDMTRLQLGKKMESEIGRRCPLLPFVLSLPGEQVDIFGILF